MAKQNAGSAKAMEERGGNGKESRCWVTNLSACPAMGLF